jgi:hypothetical protein
MALVLPVFTFASGIARAKPTIHGRQCNCQGGGSETFSRAMRVLWALEGRFGPWALVLLVEEPLMVVLHLFPEVVGVIHLPGVHSTALA